MTVAECAGSGHRRTYCRCAIAEARGDAQIATLRAENERLREALAAAEEWMSSGDAVPTTGWGALDRGADAERHAVVERARAALGGEKR